MRYTLHPAETLASILFVAHYVEHLCKSTAQTFWRNIANVNDKELKVNYGYKTRRDKIFAFENIVTCLVIDWFGTSNEIVCTLS
jgi:hypothetical protein